MGMKEDHFKFTPLHVATGTEKGHEGIVQLLLNAFSEDKNDKLIEYVMKADYKKNTALHYASSQIVQLLLNTFRKEEKDKLIEYVMKENNKKETALNLACLQQNEKIVNSLLHVFGKQNKDKLIQYVMKENEFYNETVLYIASGKVREEIVKVLKTFSEFKKEKDILIECLMKEEDNRIINRLLKTFSEEEKDKFIEFVMKEDKKKRTFLHFATNKAKKNLNLDKKQTILHFASHEGHKEIIKLLLNIFGEEEKDKLIEYVMKEDYKKYTALHFASHEGHEEIVSLLLNQFYEEKKEKIN